jgi:hypothetical protein
MDFDGCIHSYTSGWQGPGIVNDAPVPGALEFLVEASRYFRVAIYSSRSGQVGGVDAMKAWLGIWSGKRWGELPESLAAIEWPTSKPAAFLTIDDRCIQFTGKWPAASELLEFKPWNKKS